MDITTIFQITYIVGMLTISMIVVYLPRIALTGNKSPEFTPGSVRILDLTNFFAVGVFLATCFVMLMPHVELTFVSAFASFQWEAETRCKMVQLVVMVGFMLVYFLEKILDHCKNSFSDASSVDGTRNHSCTLQMVGSAPNYVVTFEKIEEDNNDEDELNREDSDTNVEASEHYSTNIINKDVISSQTVDSNDKDEEEDEDDEDESKCLVADDGVEKQGRLSKIEQRNRNDVDLNSRTSNMKTLYSAGKKLSVNKLQDVSLSLGVGQFDIRCTAMLSALCVHSVFEGVTLGLQSHMWHFLGLAGAVAIHQIVAALAVGVSLTKRQLGHVSFLISSSLFSTAIPLGVLIGILVSTFAEVNLLADHEPTLSSTTPKVIAACIQALTVGTLIYVIFVEILPTEINRQRDQVFKMFLLILGFILVTCLAFFLAKS